MNIACDNGIKEYCSDTFPTIRIKEDKVVYKKYNQDRTFDHSIIFPTDYYPLDGQGDVRIFTENNTEQVTDSKLLECFDKVEYRIGRCYTNVGELVNVLKDYGMNDFKTYVGWSIIPDTQEPVHHCWLVYADKYVLDLTDDMFVRIGNMSENNIKTEEEMRDYFVEFTRAFMDKPNSVRCYPVGKVSIFFYIGRECSPVDALEYYKKLISKYPTHKIQRNLNQNGMNKTQTKLFAEIDNLK